MVHTMTHSYLRGYFRRHTDLCKYIILKCRKLEQTGYERFNHNPIFFHFRTYFIVKSQHLALKLCSNILLLQF